MKKLLYLVTEDWYFCSHRLELAEAARHQGYEVHVLTRAGDDAERIRELGFSLHPLSIERAVGSPFTELATLFKIVTYYRRIKPDLVHHIALKPVLMGSIAAWCVRVPTVINSYTGLGYLFISNSFFSRFFRFACIPLLSVLLRTRRYHSIVQNNDDKSLLGELGLLVPERSLMIRGSGVDTERFNYSEEISQTPAIVLFASRLLRDKGIHDFIRAARLVKEKIPATRFVLVGERDEANPTSISEAELSGWVNEGIVEWWGHRDDMQQVFSQVNLVCLPSYREGLPKVLLEAAACGRAIITTDVPGCREVVEDGINGMLVPLRDSASLAEAIERLLKAPNRRRQMGIAGRERALKYFDLQRVTKETLNLYNDLLLG